MPIRRDSKGRFASGSTHRAAKAVLGPAAGRGPGGHLTIAGRKATASEVSIIRHTRAVQLQGSRDRRSGAAMHRAFDKALHKKPRRPKGAKAHG